MTHLLRLSSLLLTLSLLASCTHGGGGASSSTTDSLALEQDSILMLIDWDTLTPPLSFNTIIDFEPDTLKLALHIFDGEREAQMLPAVASQYHQLVSGTDRLKVAYERTLMGKAGAGYYIYGTWCNDMQGLVYCSTEGKLLIDGYLFSDSFLSNHTLCEIAPLPEKNVWEGRYPEAIKDTLTARYGEKVRRCYLSGLTTDGVSVYSVQLEPTSETACLGLRVVTDGDNVYILEQPAYYWGTGSAWHVDDGDEYYSIAPMAITRGPKGLDIFYFEAAVESLNYEALLIRDGVIHEFDLAQYYVYVDYQHTPDPVELPASATLSAELDGYKVWIDEEVAPSEECESGRYALYYATPESADVFLLVRTNLNEQDYSLWGKQPYVSHENVQGGNEAFLAKRNPDDDYVTVIFQGCPDSRNIFTYSTTLPLNSIEPYFRWYPVKSGYHGYDAEAKTLRLADYSYDDDGRFEEYVTYDFDGNELSRTFWTR